MVRCAGTKGQSTINFFSQTFDSIRFFRRNLQAAVSKYLVQREVAKVLSLTHAQELTMAPRNEWPLVRSQQIQEIKAVQSGQQFDIVDRRSWCYSDDTEVLVKRGWVAWPDVVASDELAIQTEDGHMTFSVPDELVKFRYKGELLHFKNQGADQLITPEHRMYGRKHVSQRRGFEKEMNFNLAKDVAKLKRLDPQRDFCKFKVPVSCLPVVVEPPDFDTAHILTGSLTGGYAKDYYVSLEDWMAFLGLYVSEGSKQGAYVGVIQAAACPVPIYEQIQNFTPEQIRCRDEQIGYYVIICQNRTSRYHKDISELLDRMGLPYTVKDNGFHVHSVAVWKAMKACGWSAYEKKIPQWVKNLPSNYLEILLTWAMKGDGWVTKTGTRRYKTVSKQLADDMQEVFAKIGSAATITMEEDRMGDSGRRIAPIFMVFEMSRKEVGVELYESVKYDGYVYCATVPGGLLYTRRNGKPVWSGNSFPYLPEALHRLNQPILKSTPYNLRRFCFSADTEVLTRRGWVFWPKVLEDDVFITYDIQTGNAEWEKPEKLYKYWYKGEMFQYENKFVDLLVTPDHKHLGRFRKASNYWDGNISCPECGKSLKTPQAMGSHRKKVHGVSGASNNLRDEKSYTYSKLGLVRANVIEKFQRKFKSCVYAFEAPFTARWKGEMPKTYRQSDGTIEVAGKRVGLMDWVRFLGIYVAEGSSRGTLLGLDLGPTSKKPHYVQAIYAAAESSPVELYEQFIASKSTVSVRISQTDATPHNTYVRAEIRKLLNKLPWKFTEDKNDFGTHDRQLHRYLFKLGNCYTRYVPRWVKRLPPVYVKEFLDWSLMGDGHVCSYYGENLSDRRSYNTTSKRLANDMQELFQVSGSAACVYVKKQRGSKNFNLSADRQAPLYTVSEHVSDWGALPIPEKVDYEGYVYCASLPNKTVYVRRNGKPVWSGRSETPIPRRAINLIKNAVLSLKWEIAPTTEEDIADDPERELRINIATDSLKRPNNIDSFRDLMEAFLEDLILGGYGTLEPRLTPYYQRPFKCWAVDGPYSADTEVLTKNGWVFWPDVKREDELATRNEDGFLEWQKPQGLQRTRYIGNLVNFDGYGVDLCVSPDHRMFGRRVERPRWVKGEPVYRYGLEEFILAKDVAKMNMFADGTYRFQVPLTANWEGKMPANCRAGKIPIDIKDWKCPVGIKGVKELQPAKFEDKRYWVDLKDWVAFLGLYTAEGSASGVMGWSKFRGNGKRKKTPVFVAEMAASAEMNHKYEYSYNDQSCPKNVSISQSKSSRHYKKIEQLLEKMPISFSENDGGFVCRDKGFHEVMFPLGNKYGKKILNWVKELPKEYLQVFIDWYVIGDGHKRPGTERQDSMVTVSKQLADDLQEVLLKVGTSASITKKPACDVVIHGKPYKRAEHYVVQQRKKEWHGIGNPKSVPYDGYVYCASVPNGILYVRRNGFPAWCGNSTIRIFMDWTESTPDRPRFAQMTGLKGERGIVTFLDSELIYVRDNVRTSTPFGLGKVEVAFQCYSDDTEVLTKRGWVTWPEARKSDLLATRTLDGKFEWQKPNKLYKSYYCGKMVGFRSQSTDVLVTPNHRMYGWRTDQHREYVRDTKWVHWRGKGVDGAPIGFMLADDVAKLTPPNHTEYAFRVPAQSKWLGEFPPTVKNGKIKLCCQHSLGYSAWASEYEVGLMDWVRFLGLYVAEGSSSGVMRGTNKKLDKPLYVQAMAASADTSPVHPVGTGWQVTISQVSSSKHFGAIRELLDRLPWDFNYYGDNFFLTSDKTLHSILSPLGNKYTKYVPEWVKSLPSQYLQEFLTWAVKGDGYQRKMRYGNKLRTYTTSSPKLADDMQEIFQKVGSSASVLKEDGCSTLPDGRKCKYPAPIYRVSERVGEFDGLGNARKEHYDGYVYCASVPNQTLYVRRNGRPLWCGNSINAFLGVQDMAGKSGSDQVHKCFPGDTEVLTRRGWIPWKDARDDDEFATRSSEDQFQWQKPLGFVREQHDGDMIKFHNRGLDITVTPNHRMYGKRVYKDWKRNRLVYDPTDFVEAHHLFDAATNRPGKGWRGRNLGRLALADFRIPTRTVWKDGVLPAANMFELGDRKFSWEDWAAFLGIWTAEGSCLDRGNKNARKGTTPVLIAKMAASVDETSYPLKREYRIQIAQSKKTNPKKYSKIERLLKRMGFDYRAEHDRFIFTDREVWDYLRVLGTSSYTKLVPQWIKDSPVSLIQVFFDWAMMSDGTVRGRKRTYYTTSERLAGDMQELFQKIGSSAAVHSYLDGNSLMYSVEEMLRSEVSIIPFVGRGKARMPERIPYSGKVYCAMVPNGTLYCREKGYAFWSGNTWLWWNTTLNPAHLQTVRRHITNELEGQSKISLMAGAPKPEVIEVTPVTEQDLLLNWQKMLINMIAAAFDLSPMALGETDKVNKATGQVMADSDFRSSVVPTAKRVEEAITRHILHGFLGWKDLEFRFIDLEDPDALTRTIIQQRQYMMNAITPDEIRKKNNMPPLAAGWGKLTSTQMQLLLAEAMAKMTGKAMGSGMGGMGGGMGSSGMGGGSGMGGSGGMSSGMGMGGGMGMGSSSGGGMSFSAQDVGSMTPDQIQLFQEYGLLPETQELGQQMEQQQPGILNQLTDELKNFFQYSEQIEEEDEVQESPITPEDEAQQLQRFNEAEHQEDLAEKSINRRGVFGPAINDQIRKAPMRGKYPRSGGTGLDGKDFTEPLSPSNKIESVNKNYRKGRNNPYK